MNRIIAVILFLIITQFSSAEVLNVANYGISPGKDVTLQVNQLLESLKGRKGITLSFPKGEYLFYPENAVEVYRSVSNHDNGVKRMAFPLFGFEDFTLEGNGSTFMFYGRICPVILDGSKNISLKNFSIDWDTPFHHELKVVESNRKNNSFVAQISPMKYGFEIVDDQMLLNHYDWKDPIGQNVAFDPKTSAPIFDSKDYSLNTKKILQ